MKSVFGISAVLLLFLAHELLQNGIKTAIVFFAISIIISVFFLLLHPSIDILVAKTSRDYCFRRHQEYIEKQQEAIKRMEEEILKHRKA